ncbi:uncharacterized protein B0H18DRAFT_635662 [Fomitopsis serialis]|uniref:uncharacterized protein n=1 Tax=Fomitopsis serialis TaxID=139415 RepID=UPI0020078261|nr:uncharacterized protein B0H18DRAFT_635662 [Neoantrodia serialis]KAH9919381.1 hypothetical protein B0H18DRAFT_635662 [Neoantrodia serialis]
MRTLAPNEFYGLLDETCKQVVSHWDTHKMLYQKSPTPTQLREQFAVTLVQVALSRLGIDWRHFILPWVDRDSDNGDRWHDIILRWTTPGLVHVICFQVQTTQPVSGQYSTSGFVDCISSRKYLPCSFESAVSDL